MTVYYFKGCPIAAPFIIRSNQTTWDKDSISLKTNRATLPAQRWELSFTLVSSSGLADYLVDMVTNFDTPQTMVMPQLTEVVKATTATGGSATGIAGATTASVTSLSGVLPKGSFVKFQNHGKIYLTKNTLTNSGTLQLYPPLSVAVPAATPLYHPGTTIKPSITYVQEIDNVRGITFSDGVLMDSGTIDLKEVV